MDQVFASICSSDSSKISSRNLKYESGIEKLEKVNGNAQDLLKFLGDTQDNICLVIIDFAGLSTYIDDLKKFVKCLFVVLFED
ncbi:hypothetical protein BCV72DRAFT_233289 [Rhizopus microsporus var. microsporus]|uniref:Uncharacterized protein n=2 Tax=Rhizopus microsporus TaxID=58291 RepID=A0A2G4SYB5_RHIZD|nr:uncharacterized protein RHIMIDRAFT_280455 [Rhizopus microsporus ATCC 52813]ORE03259.1 hypothetical protein BCV72DRAFT_233289 [Rhizopus microsporus var. microsporus]PHZ13771.1 hypothetical protein RHIMIDRAFT_280455 [Rhizopus microsporus ATCC 52813]